MSFVAGMAAFSRRSWPAPVLALAMVVLAGSGVLGDRGSALLNDVAALVVGIIAAAVCWWTARRARDSERHWRRWMAVAMAGWTAGVAVWIFYPSVRHAEFPGPSPADAGFFILPVLALPALVSFAREPSTQPTMRRRHLRVVSVLDSIAIVGCLFAVMWSAALGAVVHPSTASRSSLAVAFAYPIADFILVVFVLLLWLLGRVPSQLRTQLAYLGAALTTLAVAHSFCALAVASGAAELPALTAAGFVLSPMLIVLAATAPACSADVSAEARARARRVHAVLPYVVVAVMVVVVTIEFVVGFRIDPVVLGIGWVVLIAVVSRQVITQVENSALLREVAAAQVELEHLAYHDPLTGAANRAYFDSELGAALRRHRDGWPLSLLLIDVNRFKAVNDRFGHVAGDQLLRTLAKRLLTCVRHGDVVARIGGDEFVIVVNGDLSSAAAVAERILTASQKPYALCGNTTAVGVSVGVVEIPTDSGETAEELLSWVDAAMYQSKRFRKPMSANWDGTDIGASSRATIFTESPRQRAPCHCRPKNQRDGVGVLRQPSQSSTAAAVQDCCMLPSGSPVNGS